MEIALQMGNEMDRVVVTGKVRSRSSRGQWKLHCTLEMENKIDRVVDTESRVQSKLQCRGNEKWVHSLA